jgi:hypothetical protein
MEEREIIGELNEWKIKELKEWNGTNSNLCILAITV